MAPRVLWTDRDRSGREVASSGITVTILLIPSGFRTANSSRFGRSPRRNTSRRARSRHVSTRLIAIHGSLRRSALWNGAVSSLDPRAWKAVSCSVPQASAPRLTPIRPLSRTFRTSPTGQVPRAENRDASTGAVRPTAAMTQVPAEAYQTAAPTTRARRLVIDPNDPNISPLRKFKIERLPNLLESVQRGRYIPPEIIAACRTT